MITATELDNLAEKYETKEFVKDDPVRFGHKFKNKQDIEIACFLASLFAYGKREIFIGKLNEMFSTMQDKPLDFVLQGDLKLFKNFVYRFSKGEDIMDILRILRELYSKDAGLEKLFEHGYREGKIFETVTDYFYSRTKLAQAGFYFMIPNPRNGGAMKRMNMLLRWLVRDGEVDFGLWKFMNKSELLIPLDVHVGRISRELGLLERKQNDFKAVIQLTEMLKKFDAKDPTKYDFALFGYGVNR